MVFTRKSSIFSAFNTLFAMNDSDTPNPTSPSSLKLTKFLLGLFLFLGIVCVLLLLRVVSGQECFFWCCLDRGYCDYITSMLERKQEVAIIRELVRAAYKNCKNKS